MKKTILLLVLLLISINLTSCLFKKDSENKISIENEKMLTDYLKENISKLSPEKEMLGGKFYITDIRFKDQENAIINYEDGHITLEANLNFKINKNKVEVVSFELTENEVVVNSTHMQCSAHEDCIPLPCCHPHECINKKYQNTYTQTEACTMMYDNCAAYEDDNCLCQQGICFNENLMSQECSNQ